jgi:hypothetical protein
MPTKKSMRWLAEIELKGEQPGKLTVFVKGESYTVKLSWNNMHPVSAYVESNTMGPYDSVLKATQAGLKWFYKKFPNRNIHG